MKIPKTDKEREELAKHPARSGKIVTRGTGKVSKEFWKLPRVEDPEGLALKSLLEDREHGR